MGVEVTLALLQIELTALVILSCGSDRCGPGPLCRGTCRSQLSYPLKVRLAETSLLLRE